MDPCTYFNLSHELGGKNEKKGKQKSANKPSAWRHELYMVFPVTKCAAERLATVALSAAFLFFSLSFRSTTCTMPFLPSSIPSGQESAMPLCLRQVTLFWDSMCLSGTPTQSQYLESGRFLSCRWAP